MRQFIDEFGEVLYYKEPTEKFLAKFPYKVSIPAPDPQQWKNMKVWINNNRVDLWCITFGTPVVFHFKNPNDALLFKMRW